MEYVILGILVLVGLAALGAAVSGKNRSRRLAMLAVWLVSWAVAGYVFFGAGRGGQKEVSVATVTPAAPPTTAPTNTLPKPTVPPTNTPAPAPSPGTSPLGKPVPTAESGVGKGYGLILFHSERSGNFDIWLLKEKEGTFTRLTDSPERDIEPAWSPDGSMIAFASGRDDPENIQVYLMKADGSDQKRLTKDLKSDNWRPRWSPDGKKILYQSNRNVVKRGFDLYVINVDGSDDHAITSSQYNESSGDWSPDGKKIVYVSDQDGDRDIYVMNADGSNPVKLTDNFFDDNHPRWSPDGKWILFDSNREGRYGIYVMKPDGSGVRRVTDYLGDAVTGTWTDGGKRIVFSSNREDKDWELYSVGVDGSGLVRLTYSEGLDRFPDWSSAKRRCHQRSPVAAATSDVPATRAGRSSPSGAMRYANV